MTNDKTVAVFATPLPMTVSQYDLVGPAADRLYDLTIRRSYCTVLLYMYFGDNRARGLLLLTSNIMLGDVVVDHPTRECMMAEPDGCIWLEGFV